MGARIDGREGGAFAPLAVRGGNLVGHADELPVASAQVKTALLLAGLHAEGITEVAEPAASRDHTERMLAALGAPIERIDRRRVRIRSGAVRPFDGEVPGDPSSAAFWVVGATIVAGSEIVVEGVLLNPSRIAFVDVLRRMGAQITVEPRGERVGEPVGDLTVVAAPLRGTVIEGAEVPAVIDELPDPGDRCGVRRRHDGDPRRGGAAPQGERSNRQHRGNAPGLRRRNRDRTRLPRRRRRETPSR